MSKTPISPSSAAPVGPRLCPTCGTRVGAAATKCLVCGTDLSETPTGNTGRQPSQRRAASSQITLPLPALFGFVLVVLLIGAGLVWLALNGSMPFVAERATETSTATNTLPPTVSPTPTSTETPIPTSTPLPPNEYVVQSGNTCISIAVNAQVTVASIEAANPGLNCQFLTVGQKVMVPQPTHTPTALPSATLPPNIVTVPTRPTYTVVSGDTLAGIARFYKLNIADLMAVNGITDPNAIQAGNVLIIPLELAVTPGPTPTATNPPPWPPPNLLGPKDGDAFQADETLTLQWTSVGELRPGEFYYVSIEDVTCGCALIKNYAVSENKLIVPAELLPTEAIPHLFRWTVTTVRQRNLGEPGNPIYDSAGATSPARGFIWAGP